MSITVLTFNILATRNGSTWTGWRSQPVFPAYGVIKLMLAQNHFTA